MFDYILKLIDEMPDNMRGTAETTAANHLFMTSQECGKLPERTAQVFHHLLA